MESCDVMVFGAGYVGLVTGACLADSGHRVVVVDVDQDKVARLEQGEIPFFEPGLAEIVQGSMADGRLRFKIAAGQQMAARFVIIAVGTPSALGGGADLKYVRSVIDDVAAWATPETVVVMKSTVPPGTGQRIAAQLKASGVEYVSNPEFLREGSAVTDWFKTDRIVLGGSALGVDRAAALYKGIDAPILKCDIQSAELIKYASNAFLATKISYANEIARLCDRVDADVKVVLEGVGLDSRIGKAFLNAGIGYGGSCFPKDSLALKQLASNSGYHFQLLSAVIEVNELQKRRIIGKLTRHLGPLRGRTVALLGLAFKPETDDMREAPSIVLASRLLAEGATVRAWDPVADGSTLPQGVEVVDSVLAAVHGADAAVIVTEWAELRGLASPEVRAAMTTPLIIDGRNLLDPEAVRQAGFAYEGIGRPTSSTDVLPETPEPVVQPVAQGL